jgi:hypothetical protein
MTAWVRLLLLVQFASVKAFTTPLVLTRLLKPQRSFVLSRHASLESHLRLHKTQLNLFENDQLDLSRQDSTTLSKQGGLISTILLPAAQILDNVTSGWALNYADLRPESENTTLGQAFLATNLAYAALGWTCFATNDFWLGTLVELASLASFTYHYTQLSRKDASVVRLALMVDYVVAGMGLLTGLSYILIDPSAISQEAYVVSILAVLCLLLGWVWEEGMPYCITHGLWHLLGAYAGYLIVQAHAPTLALFS